MSFSDDSKNNYISEFCDNIKKYGTYEDITALATHVNQSANFPMLISTLTRKFYFTFNSQRGLYHLTTELHTTISHKISLKTTARIGMKQSEVNPRHYSKSTNLSKSTTSVKTKISSSSKDVRVIQNKRTTVSGAHSPKSTKPSEHSVGIIDKPGSSTDLTDKPKPDIEEVESNKSIMTEETNITKTSTIMARRQSSTTPTRYRIKSTNSVDGNQTSEKPRWNY